MDHCSGLKSGKIGWDSYGAKTEFVYSRRIVGTKIMNTKSCGILSSGYLTLLLIAGPTIALCAAEGDNHIGVGAKPIAGAEVILDGSREMLDAKWTYWQGPRFASSMPIKWQIVDDPVDKGTAISTD